MLPLSESAKEKITGLRIVAVQAIVAMLATTVAYLYSDAWSVASAMLWGSMVAALNSLLLVRGLSKCERVKSCKPNLLLQAMYQVTAERIFLVILLLLLGMGGLKLSAGVVLSGFVVGQAALIIARILMIKR
jgi:ATP synthase I chain